MITLGFKNKMSGVIRALTAIILGSIMVAFPQTSLLVIVKILAAFLIASGIVSLVYGIANRANGGFSLMVTNTAVDIILGIIIFIFPAEVAGVVMFIIGLALFAFGMFQILALASANRVLRVGFVSFLLPVLCSIGGALVIFKPFGIASWLTLVVGIVLLVYGASELVSTWKVRKAMKEYEIRLDPSVRKDGARESIGADVKDVPYEKVD